MTPRADCRIDDVRAGDGRTPMRAPKLTAWVGMAALGLGSLLLAGAARAEPSAAGGFDPAPLQARAANGDPTAAFQLGTLDYVGLGVVQDYIGAAHLLTEAGDAGNAEAQCELGFLYQTGSFAQGPPPPDPADAVPLYEKAAASGNACGEFALGAMYETGQVVPKDPAMAASLFGKAAAQGFTLDPSSFPLEQLQQRFYAVAYQLTGQSQWTDLVSNHAAAGN